jgi:hypothetical protein
MARHIWILALLLCASVNGQEILSVSDGTAKRATFEVQTLTITREGAEIGVVESQTAPKPAGQTAIKLIEVSAPTAVLSFFTVREGAIENAESSFTQIENGTWIVSKGGRYLVRASVFDVDFVNQTVDRREESKTIEVSGAAPIPPSPDVENTFGVGAVAASFAPNDPDTRAEVRELFRQAANFLYGNPTLKTVDNANGNSADNNVFIWLGAHMSKMDCPNEETCADWALFQVELSAAIERAQESKTLDRAEWYRLFHEVRSAIK